MSLVNEGTPVTAVPELDIFSKAPVQVSIEKSYIEEVRPLAPLNTGGHIEFIINSGENEYVRLNDTTLYGRFHVELHKTGATPDISEADWNKIHIVNNFMHSLWYQIDLSIGDTQTSLSLQTYPYKAYIETVLASTHQARKTYLKSTIFNEDTPTGTSNDDRRAYIVSFDNSRPSMGKSCEFEGKLHLDLCQQNRPILGGTKIKIRLVPHNSKFYFMCNDANLEPRIVFDELYLNVSKFKTSLEIFVAHTKALDVAPAKYIMERVEVRALTIDSGVTSKNIENVIHGRLPRRVYIAFVDNAAYTGSYLKNPFNFEHCNINSIACFVDGEQIPQRAYSPDFSKDRYTREYIN